MQTFCLCERGWSVANRIPIRVPKGLWTLSRLDIEYWAVPGQIWQKYYLFGLIWLLKNLKKHVGMWQPFSQHPYQWILYNYFSNSKCFLKKKTPIFSLDRAIVTISIYACVCDKDRFCVLFLMYLTRRLDFLLSVKLYESVYVGLVAGEGDRKSLRIGIDR